MIANVLSIAGSDPSGGAGIQADLKTFSALGAYGMAVITALTAQNTQGVRSFQTVDPGFVAEQIDAIFADVRVDAVKIGMVATAEIATAIADRLRHHGVRNVVLDPVMVAKSGHHLLREDAVAALRDTLVPLARVITPNLPEAGVLLGGPAPATLADMRRAVRELHRLGPQWVLLKGGHLAGADSTDLLFDGDDDHRTARPADRYAQHARHRLHAVGRDRRVAAAVRHGRGGASREGVSDRCDRRERSSDGRQRPRSGASLPRTLDGGRRAMTQFSEAAWQRTARLRQAIDELPFNTELAAGTLSRERFQGYIVQDALYLAQYSRILAIAGARGPDAETLRAFGSCALEAVAVEQALHERYLTEFGVDPARLVDAEPSPDCLGYTSFLLATAYHEPWEVLVAALLPCFWIYWDVGSRVARHAAADNPYRAWIDTYADEGFGEAVRTVIGITDRAAEATTAAIRARMMTAFVRSTQYEWLFWDGAYQQRGWPSP